MPLALAELDMQHVETGHLARVAVADREVDGRRQAFGIIAADGVRDPPRKLRRDWNSLGRGRGRTAVGGVAGFGLAGAGAGAAVFGVAGAAVDCAKKKLALKNRVAVTYSDLKDTKNLSIYAGIALFRLSHAEFRITHRQENVRLLASLQLLQRQHRIHRPRAKAFQV